MLIKTLLKAGIDPNLVEDYDYNKTVAKEDSTLDDLYLVRVTGFFYTDNIRFI